MEYGDGQDLPPPGQPEAFPSGQPEAYAQPEAPPPPAAGGEPYAPAGGTERRAAPPKLDGPSEQNSFMMMEEILERLKLLNYEQTFFPKGFRPLTRTFFAMPSSNPAEQFHYFTTLATWLMNKLGNDCKPPSHYDDPNSTVANLSARTLRARAADSPTPLRAHAVRMRRSDGSRSFHRRPCSRTRAARRAQPSSSRSSTCRTTTRQ